MYLASAAKKANSFCSQRRLRSWAELEAINLSQQQQQLFFGVRSEARDKEEMRGEQREKGEQRRKEKKAPRANQLPSIFSTMGSHPQNLTTSPVRTHPVRAPPIAVTRSLVHTERFLCLVPVFSCFCACFCVLFCPATDLLEGYQPSLKTPFQRLDHHCLVWYHFFRFKKSSFHLARAESRNEPGESSRESRTSTVV